MTKPASALIADIGATNARFALLEGTELAVSETYAVADYASPIEAARHFLSGPAAGHTPKRALIAAAGRSSTDGWLSRMPPGSSIRSASPRVSP